MSLHLTFNKMRQSEAVSAHIHDMFEELIKITDNKFPFHVRLNKEGDETYLWASTAIITASSW